MSIANQDRLRRRHILVALAALASGTVETVSRHKDTVQLAGTEATIPLDAHTASSNLTKLQKGDRGQTEACSAVSAKEQLGN